MRRFLALAASVAVLLTGLVAFAPRARADGFLIPVQPDRRVRGDWAVNYHRVDVVTDGQKAHVRVDEEFQNLGSSLLETIYVFPLPAGAMISGVTLMVDGKGLEGRLLRREEARAVYEEIVRRKRDPALVEYLGRDMFQASIFPIPPGGTRQLVLEYDHFLPKDGDMIELIYPLNTEKFSARPLRNVRVSVDIASPTPIGPIYSPSHDVAIVRKDAKHAQASFEANATRPETDFLLYWSAAPGDLGATMLTHWPRGEDRGYFLFLASPTVPDGQAMAAKPKELTLCVDVSGSMAGDKLEQAKAALRQVIGGLNDGDRFNVISYHSAVVPLWDDVQTASADHRAEAMKFVDGLKAMGGTNIHDALKAAIAGGGALGLPRVILFLTDGRPTMGETTDLDAILKNVTAWNTKPQVRLFVFGVGVDVNSVLLDKLALSNHGTPTYVRPQEDVERKVASLYEKIRYPVMTDLKIEFGGISASETIPGALPDLFRGGQLVIAGRYKKGGFVDVVVSGLDGTAGREFPYHMPVASEGQGLRDDFPARVWATRRIGDLVDQIRLTGRQEKELVDEIVHLSTKFGILTEYTAFLADETADHGRLMDNTRRTLSNLDDLKAKAEGGWGFAQGANQEARRGADRPAAPAASPMGPPPAATTPPPALAGSGGGAGGAFPPTDGAGKAPDSGGGSSSPEGGTSLGFLKAAKGDRDVEEEKSQGGGGVRQVGNRAFYKRAVAWVDAEVKDASHVDETVARWSPRFFELLASTNADENARLAQEGSVLLRLGEKNVLVTDSGDPK